MKVIVSVTLGTDDPTRATLGMLAAKMAVDQGHDVVVWLQGEATTLANRLVYAGVIGVNMPPMKGIVEALVGAGVPIWICEACGRGRGVGPDNWIGNASYQTMGAYVAAVLHRDKSLCF